MLTPRLLLLLALAAFPAFAYAGTEVAPIPDLPTIKARALGPDKEPAVVVSSASAAALEKAGWKALSDGGLERLEGPDRGVIPAEYIAKADLKWKGGILFYDRSPEAVPPDMFPPIFKGLSSFTSAARADRDKVGAALAAWGLPPAVDGEIVSVAIGAMGLDDALGGGVEIELLVLAPA